MRLRFIPFVLLLLVASCNTIEPVKPGSLENIMGSYVSEKMVLFPDINMYLNFQFDNTGKNGTFVARIENRTDGNNYAENVGGDFVNIADNPLDELVIERFPIPSSTGLYFIEGTGSLKPAEGVLATTLDVAKKEEQETYTVNFKPAGGN